MNLKEAMRIACNVGDRIQRPCWGDDEYMERVIIDDKHAPPWESDRWVDEDGDTDYWAFNGLAVDETRNDDADDWKVIIPPPRKENPDVKDTAGKDPMGWIPLTALRGVARQMAKGGAKYPRGNFATARYDDDTADRYMSAALRHLSTAQAPGGVWSMDRVASQRDVDTGELEIDAVIANLLMLREVIARKAGGS